jgi:hypothetical protein
MQGYDVVTSDDHKIGHVVGEEHDCLIVEHGHVFKSRHALPRTFAHVDSADNVVRATITKDVFTASPKITEGWSCEEVNVYYGITGQFEVDPDPTDPDSITTDDHSRERVALREGPDRNADMPKVRERMANANDPAGDTANLR